MNQYGRVAARAARMLAADVSLATRAAWDSAAAELVRESDSARDKGCPRRAFLGLCAAGVVKGVGCRSLDAGGVNGDYAVRAYRALCANQALEGSQVELWRQACPGKAKKHNGQMDVLVGLWQAGLLIGGRLSGYSHRPETTSSLGVGDYLSDTGLAWPPSVGS